MYETCSKNVPNEGNLEIGQILVSSYHTASLPDQLGAVRQSRIHAYLKNTQAKPPLTALIQKSI